MDKKLSFIGCGNIASAMIKGIVKSKILPSSCIMASDKSGEKLKTIKADLDIKVTSDNIEAAKYGDIIFLCVEPKIIQTVISQIKEVITKDQIIVSVAAGISLADLNNQFNEGTKIVRIMPNIPITVGEGIVMICESDIIDEKELKYLIEVINSFGKVEVMSEKYINAFTAVASSSPAFVYIMIEAMADAAVAMGISRKRAYNITSQAVLGAAKMVLETGKHPGELKDMVCSPAGTTIDAIASLEATGFRHSILQALKVGEEKCSRISKG